MLRNVLRYLIPLAVMSIVGSTAAMSFEYRTEHYRAPTPATLQGAEVVATEGAREWIEAGAIPVDTTPITRTGFTDMTGKWNVVEPRLNIPGSLWLPNIGYGVLDAEMLDYFRTHLAQVTAGKADVPLLFYCYADCWMSWNAAKRAVEMGYERVIWYPDGTDGWRAEGLLLVDGSPAPLFEER